MNTALWTVGLVLQFLVLVALLRSGLARRLPFFTALIAFYLARSAFLYVGSSLIEDDAYKVCTQVLSLIDLAFQVVVAWELLNGGRRMGNAPIEGASRGRLAILFAVMIVVSAAVAWGLSEVSPINRFKQFDRGVILTSTLWILVAASVIFRKRELHATAANRLLAGYFFLGAAGISGQIGRAVSASARNGHAYIAWSYVTALVYLAVSAFWLIALTRVSTRPLLKKPRKAMAGAG